MLIKSDAFEGVNVIPFVGLAAVAFDDSTQEEISKIASFLVSFPLFCYVHHEKCLLCYLHHYLVLRNSFLQFQKQHLKIIEIIQFSSAEQINQRTVCDSIVCTVFA